MKVEKGKVYYNHQLECVVREHSDYDDTSGVLSDKVAVHCPTQEDWDYVTDKMGYEWGGSSNWGFYEDYTCITLNTDNFSPIRFYSVNGYRIIGIEEFKKLFTEPMHDVVNKPKHYTQGKIEVIDFITDQNLNFTEANVVKYVCRYKYKNGLEDLKKAKWYLEYLIKQHESTVND